MEKRQDHMVLRILKSTILSGIAITILFSGMALSIWHLLDSTRILEKFMTMGRIDARIEKGHPGDDLAAVTAFESSVFMGKIKDRDQIEIVVVSPEKENFRLSGTVSGSIVKETNGNNLFTFAVLLDPEQEMGAVEDLFLKKQYCPMEIYLRTQKIWEILFEKGMDRIKA